MRNSCLNKRRYIVRPVIAQLLPLLLMVCLGLFITGCSSNSDDIVIPEPGSVPLPSMEEGDTPEPGKLRRVKID